MTLMTTTEKGNVVSCARVGSVWKKPFVWIGLSVMVLAGLALNWNWLLAAGALPILFGVLPCLAMCALHLCSGRTGKGTDGDGRTAANAVMPPR